MRHVLFIAFHFPPEASSSGVLRTLKHARYLVGYGWRVTVITPRTDAYAVTDPQLERQIPANATVIRTRWLNTRQHFALFGVYPALLALPDSWVGWLPWAVAAGGRVIASDRPDMIYSTSPHATAHLIALLLARRSDIPWVADFRDPWFEDLPEPGAPAGRLYRNLNRGLERQVVERCNHVVTTTTYLRDSLCKRYTSVPAMKMTAIPNGYDEADFADFTPSPKDHFERLLVVHAGSINSEFRDPRPLFRSLRTLIDNGTIDRNRVMLRFIGGGEFARSEAIRTSLSQNDLSAQVEFVDRMSYVTALQELGRADLLLLLQASADTVDLIPAKVYEYLRAEKPILALVYPGATSELLGTVGGGWPVDPRDAAALENSLAIAYNAWLSNSLVAYSARPEAVRQFDRKALAGELANLFDRLCTSQSR